MLPKVQCGAHSRMGETDARTWDISPVQYTSASAPSSTEPPEPAQIAMVLTVRVFPHATWTGRKRKHVRNPYSTPSKLIENKRTMGDPDVLFDHLLQCLHLHFIIESDKPPHSTLQAPVRPMSGLLQGVYHASKFAIQ